MKQVAVLQATQKGYIECNIGGVADLSYPTSKLRRGRVIDGGEVSPTVMTSEQGIYRIEDEYRIRKLTAKECIRLMNFDDSDYDAMAEEVSQTQIYKAAGNSICVCCLTAIFSQLGIGGTKWNDRSIEERDRLSQNVMRIIE